MHLLKYYCMQYPKDAFKLVLSIEDAYDPVTVTPLSQPAQIRTAVDGSLRVLDGSKTIDVFQMARVDSQGADRGERRAAGGAGGRG